MKTSLSRPLTLLFVASLFAACFTDDEIKHLSHTYTGPLSSLTPIQDPSTTRLQWRLNVDVDDNTVLKGECTWTGYLGDSVAVKIQDSPALYTNTSMGGTKKASVFRSEGVILSMDSASQASTLTHYRAEFECEY